MSERDRLLPRNAVEERLGITTSTLYRWMRGDGFPAPRRLGSRCVRWSEFEIEDWIAARPRATGDGPRVAA